MDWLGAGMTLVTNAIGHQYSKELTRLNNDLAAQREATARAENYKYGELQAGAADARTRALYEDYASPQALLRQYKEAGLSPSMMFGKGGGAGGASIPTGAMGPSAAVGATTYGMNPIDAAAIGKTLAETSLIRAEKKNVEANTDITNVEKDIKELNLNLQSVDFKMVTAYMEDEEKGTVSLSELADASYDYDDFLKHVRTYAANSGNSEFLNSCGTERGQQTLRIIYNANNKLRNEIAILSESTVNAKFQESVLNALKAENFAEMNAKEVLSHIRSNIAENELTQKQRDAWNNILNKLAKRNSDAADYAIVLGLILNNALSNYRMPNKKSFTTNINNNVKE